ncbi:hypothetical protein FJ364_04555, partial [Candidatus Dependentiae bacterium]|nr:hypothetical protein [Candidatus Dependentiae bacterium]
MANKDKELEAAPANIATAIEDMLELDKTYLASIQKLATISDKALDDAYGYGRSTPGNSFGWQANLMSAAFAKEMIDAGITDIEKISDAIHRGWNVTAEKFVQNPNQFSDTAKLRQEGKLEAKLKQRAKLMKIDYAQLDKDEKEKDRVVARALLNSITDPTDPKSLTEEVTKTSSAEAVAKTPSAEAVAKTPSAEEVAKTPSAVAVTEMPSAEAVTKTPSAEEVAKTPSAVAVTEMPSAEAVTKTPSAEEVTEKSEKASSVSPTIEKTSSVKIRKGKIKDNNKEKFLKRHQNLIDDTKKQFFGINTKKQVRDEIKIVTDTTDKTLAPIAEIDKSGQQKFRDPNTGRYTTEPSAPSDSVKKEVKASEDKNKSAGDAKQANLDPTLQWREHTLAPTDKVSILVPLAKELGYKNVEEMRNALSKEQAGRGGRRSLGFGVVGGPKGVGTGFLGGREIGGGFEVGIKKRLAEGVSIKESVAGGFQDWKKTFSKENIKRRLLEKAFGGTSFIDTFARGQLKKKFGVSEDTDFDDEKEKDSGKNISPTADTADADNIAGADNIAETNRYLEIIAKNSLSFHLMSRDLNVLRQNIVTLTKIDSEKFNKGKSKKKQIHARDPAMGHGADAWFLREDEREEKLEAQRRKSAAPAALTTAPTPAGGGQEKEGEDDGGGLLSGILGLLASSLMSGLAAMFNPMAILGVLSKVFVIGAIFMSLFEGITAAWDKWKETGSISEAIIEGLTAIIDFLTFGLFGKDSIKKLFSGIGDFLAPITDTIKNVFSSIKNWIVNNVGIPKISLG